ncbi:hypothetical protein A2767_03565 [Candidatus Roizmanbacteria bacterium RIFCSPHIGHO2_01_FULL_35_10]|uniref:Glycosyltransferase RgtA/B/C/D-like domain-containing protein n=1 Tax=Candidatus Roizmanbacteria bacterium RIFCSPLOWO2_01_FULL_35_13 TaxID=1802055 RepID=A0A1F7IA14_9BACT|nr:MAG: hypothetical protein A2767_03565 [Candidatus Roizmanbacteria bacterium RIFCSPHIGHO2_01_FULL_35_10]OGK40204.1 MAG: hypothetical protein A3A74_06880 [Candidatus Roizmanbacteria bacterium RIFCSPLOWO2_01_FULL_35_13]
MTSSKIFLLTIVISLFIFVRVYYRNFVLTSDFVNIYTAISMVKNGQGNQLYDIDWQKINQSKIVKYTAIEFLPFRHSPLVALLFFPFTFLGLGKAYLLFAYINILGLYLFYLLAKKIFVHISGNLLYAILIFLSLPTLRALVSGQTPILLSLVFLIFYVFLKRQNWFMAGMFGGLIFFLKIQLFILIPFIFLLSNYKKKFITGFILSSILLFFISLRVVGLPGLLKYLGFIIETEKSIYGSHLWDSFAMASLLFRMGINGVGLLTVNIFLYVFALLFFKRDLKNRSFDEMFAISTLLVALFSVHFLAHDLTILNVTILILFNRYYEFNKDNKQIFYVAVLLYSLIFFLVVPVIFGINFNLGPLILLLTIFILFKRKI